MTTVYIPRLIETAEQAEALPVGTVAIESGEQGQAVGASIRVRGGWHCTGETEAYGGMWLVPHDRMIGDTALVPVEAEEEHTRPVHLYASTVHVAPSSTTGKPSLRLVTHWEEA